MLSYRQSRLRAFSWCDMCVAEMQTVKLSHIHQSWAATPALMFHRSPIWSPCISCVDADGGVGISGLVPRLSLGSGGAVQQLSDNAKDRLCASWVSCHQDNCPRQLVTTFCFSSLNKAVKLLQVKNVQPPHRLSRISFIYMFICSELLPAHSCNMRQRTDKCSRLRVSVGLEQSIRLLQCAAHSAAWRLCCTVSVSVSETCLIAGWRDSNLSQYTGLVFITLSNVMASHG